MNHIMVMNHGYESYYLLFLIRANDFSLKFVSGQGIDFYGI